MTEIKIDHDLKSLLPELSEDQKESLEKDILKNGCLNPLIIWDGILIDGHHRYAICTKHSIPFDVIEMDFTSKLEAMEWSWSNQKNRRNLNKYELAQIALKFKSTIEAKAKENQGLRTDITPVRNLTNVDTKKELAKLAGVSHDTIHKVEVIEEQAPDDIKQQVKTGEMSINNAYILTKSSVETKKKNEEYEKKYQEQLEKERLEREEKEKQKELEESLPNNALVLDRFRKLKTTYIFGIEDFNNLSNDQFEKCLKLSKKYQDSIHKIGTLSVEEDSLKAWNCISDTEEMIDIELNTIGIAIQKLITIQNYFKGVRK